MGKPVGAQYDPEIARHAKLRAEYVTASDQTIKAINTLVHLISSQTGKASSVVGNGVNSKAVDALAAQLTLQMRAAASASEKKIARELGL